MNTNLYKLLKYINDYSKENGKCPTYQEISIGINVNRFKVGELIRSCEVLKLLVPIKVRNRSRYERNHKLSEEGLKYLNCV